MLYNTQTLQCTRKHINKYFHYCGQGLVFSQCAETLLGIGSGGGSSGGWRKLQLSNFIQAAVNNCYKEEEKNKNNMPEI